ncbi:hypothetical protein F5146DRAFT_1072864 [Armillaria mellea]|nr:hypothetical protein F5146DRAFT_1072864 [Armillaria mellea]
MSLDASSPVAGTPSLGMTMGSIFFSLMITAMLYGISFFRIIDTVQLGMTINALYFYLVSSHGNYQVLLQLNWHIGRHFHVVLPWCAFIAVAASLAMGIYAVPTETGFATTAATDLIIASMMCFYLHKGREMSHMSSTIKIVVALMRLVIMSGLVTGVCSLLALVSDIMWPNSLLFVAFRIALPSFHINSLLAMLNYHRISTKLAIDLGHPISAPESGMVLEFSPNESGDTAL